MQGLQNPRAFTRIILNFFKITFLSHFFYKLFCKSAKTLYCIFLRFEYIFRMHIKSRHILFVFSFQFSQFQKLESSDQKAVIIRSDIEMFYFRRDLNSRPSVLEEKTLPQDLLVNLKSKQILISIMYILQSHNPCIIEV